MQNYKNHVRYYIPHHFVFYPIVLALVGFSIRKAMLDEVNASLWIIITVLFFMLGWLSFMLRQHYALSLQNRLVVLEVRYRYHVLTQKRFELLEDALNFGQIAALRFASDAELPALVERTLSESLSPDSIKKSIINWCPDNKRV
ncbi:MAG: DUF6526 family protein [Bacteroidota bacterium]